MLACWYILVDCLSISFSVSLNRKDRKVFDSVRAGGRTAGVYVQGLGCDDAVHALEGQFGRDEFLHWHGQDDGVDAGRQRKRAGIPTEMAEKLKALERENRELRQANEILRKASAYFAMAELDRRSK